MKELDPAFHVETSEAPGCYPNGTRVVKSWCEDGDTHPLGAKATVLGSIAHPDVGSGYFVEWDDMPGVPVFVHSKKVSEV